MRKSYWRVRLWTGGVHGKVSHRQLSAEQTLLAPRLRTAYGHRTPAMRGATPEQRRTSWGYLQ